MDLKSILIPERSVKFDYPGCPGLKVELTFLSKESNQKLLKKCTKNEFNKKTRQFNQVLDEDLFLEEYVTSIIKGWDGFKFKYLKKLVLIDESKFKDEDEMEFSVENAISLMKNSSDFDVWVSEMVSELENFSQNNSNTKSQESKATVSKVAVG